MPELTVEKKCENCAKYNDKKCDDTGDEMPVDGHCEEHIFIRSADRPHK